MKVILRYDYFPQSMAYGWKHDNAQYLPMYFHILLKEMLTLTNFLESNVEACVQIKTHIPVILLHRSKTITIYKNVHWYTVLVAKLEKKLKYLSIGKLLNKLWFISAGKYSYFFKWVKSLSPDVTGFL